MIDSQLEEKLIAIFKTIFPDLNDLNVALAGPHNTENWDSITFVSLIFSIEEIFKIKFTNDEIIEMSDYESIKKIILDKQ